MSRIRRTAEQWEGLIERQRGSGQSVARFCARQGLALSTFLNWRRRLGESAPATFVELTPASTSGAGADAAVAIEVVLGCGVVVRVRAGFEAGLLRQVVEALS